MPFLGYHEGEPDDFWPMEMAIEEARVGDEQGIPWLVVKFALGNDVMTWPWYRAHCMN